MIAFSTMYAFLRVDSLKLYMCALAHTPMPTGPGTVEERGHFFAVAIGRPVERVPQRVRQRRRLLLGLALALQRAVPRRLRRRNGKEEEEEEVDDEVVEKVEDGRKANGVLVISCAGLVWFACCAVTGCAIVVSRLGSCTVPVHRGIA